MQILLKSVGNEDSYEYLKLLNRAFMDAATFVNLNEKTIS